MMEQEMSRMGDTNSTHVIEREFAQNKDAVVDMLVQTCMNVDTSIPRVVRGRFEEAMAQRH